MKKLFSLILVLVMISTLTIESRAAEEGRIDSTTFRSNYMITTVHIGSDVDEITSGAFRNLNNLREITVSDNNPFYTSYSGCLYDKYMTELLCFPPALSGAVIPSTVVKIGENALHGVPKELKAQITDVVVGQAMSNLNEEDIPGEHFIHTENGVKWRMADGSLISPDSNLMNLAAEIVNASSTGNMTQPQQLESAFNYLAGSVYYQRNNEVPEGDWAKEYATKTLSTRGGNCYGYAAAFAYIASGLGYDTRVCTGTVKSALGGRTPHSWTEVKLNNKWYIFDAEMQSVKGSGYYKQTYESYPAGPIEREESWKVSF
jgi:hypothetical protein